MLADKCHGHDGGAESVVMSPIPSAVTGGRGDRGSASILIKIILDHECQYSCRSTERSMLTIAILISPTLLRYLNNAAYYRT